jgi:hypothetical protein
MITLPVTLAAGTDTLSVDFPSDTDLSSVTVADVWVWSNFWGFWAQPAAITVDNQHLEFIVPIAFWPSLPAGDFIEIDVDQVVNPTVPGDYCLYVDYMIGSPAGCCDHVVFDCVEYTVIPFYSTIDLVFDFGPTYPDIAEGFVPPFKACGQENYGYLVGADWFTEFDLWVLESPLGCQPPCNTGTFWFVLEACQAGGTVTLDWNNLALPQGIGPTTFTLTEADVGDKQAIGAIDLTILPYAFNNGIHFSIPGDYQICWYLECPAVGCPTCAGPTIVAEECMDAVVYQWKDAFKIEVEPKWNLISLPLFPFDTAITSVLASMDRPDQLMSVWYFDQCTDPDPAAGTWYTDPGDGTGNLDTIEAGKAYWFRMLHPGDAGYDPAAFPVSMWVWGTHSPMPPADPTPVFDVCEGFNMIGFKAPWVGLPLLPTTEWDDLYLWNWLDLFAMAEYGVIYSWDNIAQDWLWNYPYFELMAPGVGYWIPFDHDGQIYPKP